MRSPWYCCAWAESMKSWTAGGRGLAGGAGRFEGLAARINQSWEQPEMVRRMGEGGRKKTPWSLLKKSI